MNLEPTELEPDESEAARTDSDLHLLLSGSLCRNQTPHVVFFRRKNKESNPAVNDSFSSADASVNLFTSTTSLEVEINTQNVQK